MRAAAFTFAVAAALASPYCTVASAGSEAERGKQGVSLELRRTAAGLGVCVRVASSTKLNGEFGVVIDAAASERRLWREALPKTVTADAEYLPDAFALSLAAHDPARLGRSLTFQVGVCTADGGCDILDLTVGQRELGRLRPAPAPDQPWCGPALN